MSQRDNSTTAAGQTSYVAGQSCGRGNHEYTVEFPRYFKCAKCASTKTKANYDLIAAASAVAGVAQVGGSSWANTASGWERVLHVGTKALMGGEFEVDANEVATGRTCIIGASGSGKSYTVGVLCEELLKNKVPFVIVDADGEHSGLREKYEVVVVGEGPDADLKWSRTNLAQLAADAPDMAPIVLDVSECDKPKERVAEFLTRLYEEVEERRTPYLVVVEEADRFVPQNGERLAIINEIARRGRKRGMGLVVCTQRPSMVDKNVLSQCSSQIIGKLSVKNDLQSVAQFFGNRPPSQLTLLPRGEFYVLGAISAQPTLVQVREMSTVSGGFTPQLGEELVVGGPTERVALPSWMVRRLQGCVVSSDVAAGATSVKPVMVFPCRFRAETESGSVGLSEAVEAKSSTEALGKAALMAQENGWTLVSIGKAHPKA